MELLAGAGKGREVWRIGGTVRRPTGPQTPAVHALLRHLEAVGFDGAPRVLGFDEQGREILTYVQGEPGWRGPYDDRTLGETARTIRRFHDAVADFTPPPDSAWHEAHRPAGSTARQIICHNDLSPPNTVYAPGRAPVFIDWDLAGPAPPLWDVVAAARSFVPLYVDADCEQLGIPLMPRGPRLRLFCDAYGLSERSEREGFLPLLTEYLRARDVPNTRRALNQLDAWELHRYLM